MKAQFTTGALVASVAAGPMAAAAVIAAGLLSGHDGRASLAVVPVMFIPALPFGFAIALIPNFVGAALLVAAGDGNPPSRRRMLSAAVGSLFGAAIGTVILADVAVQRAILGTIGLLGVLISRHFVGWDEAT